MICVKRIFLLLALAGGVVFAAPAKNNNDIKKQLLGNFASGSILNGSK